MTLAQTFAAARQRIADGKEPMYAFIRHERVPGGGPFETRRRPLTFGELRAAYADVIQSVRLIDEGARYRRLRSIIVAESLECQSLIRRLRDLETLPFGMRLSDYAAPLQAELETIIAGRVAEHRTGEEA